MLRFLVTFSVHIERGMRIIYCCGLNKVFSSKLPRRLPNMRTYINAGRWGYNGWNAVNITNKMSICFGITMHIITIAHFKTFSIKKNTFYTNIEHKRSWDKQNKSSLSNQRPASSKESDGTLTSELKENLLLWTCPIHLNSYCLQVAQMKTFVLKSDWPYFTMDAWEYISYQLTLSTLSPTETEYMTLLHNSNQGLNS